MNVTQLSVQSVVRATGLSAHVLRAWEKRYRAVRPARSKSGRRRYTEADLQRLLLLKRATRAGHPISTVVSRSNSELQRLLQGLPLAQTANALAAPEEELRYECIDAVRAMNEYALARALDNALVQLGHHGLLCRVVAPLGEQIGKLWRSGEITAAHEHFFTAVVRTFLGRSVQQFALAADAPTLIAATPAGQHHELGAFMAAVAATHLGWRAVYLGASLPAAEIAAAVLQSEARVLVLSIIYPSDDRKLINELRAIRRHLPEVNLIVGGRATHSYRAALKSVNARIIIDLAQLGDELDQIRARFLVGNKNAFRDKRRDKVRLRNDHRSQLRGQISA